MNRLLRVLARELPALAALALALAFLWGTLTSTAAARLAVLRPIEAYALAVHEQLIRNRALEGAWEQTIHAGYDDAWTWSGHRSLTLVLSTWIYRLAPTALGLCAWQIAAVLAGAIPAALIGRRLFADTPAGPRLGMAFGGLVYLACPPVLVLALQDYQDLCFALPALVFCLWTLRAGHPAWVLPGAFVGIMPREECVPLVVAAALLTIPAAGRRRYAWNVVVSVLVAGGYALLAQALHPIELKPGEGDGHDTPLVNALAEVVAALRGEGLPGLPWLTSFYLPLLLPLGLLGLASPLTVAPALGLLFMHMTVPQQYGVDRSYVDHVHHLAPILAFLLVAVIEGAARLAGWSARLGAGARPAVALGLGLSLVFAAHHTARFGQGYHLAWSWTRWTPPYQHPAWTLAERLPADAVPVVSVKHSVVASGRARSYTWEESIHDKARGQGLGAATHMIAPLACTEAVEWAMTMPGARVVDHSENHVTITWDAGARDPSPRRREDRWTPPWDWVPAGYHLDAMPGVPPRPTGGP